MQSNASTHNSSNSMTHAATQADVINIKENEELARWVQTLGVSEEQLRMAVAAVGVQVDDVRNHFGVLRTAA